MKIILQTESPELNKWAKELGAKYETVTVERKTDSTILTYHQLKR